MNRFVFPCSRFCFVVLLCAVGTYFAQGAASAQTPGANQVQALLRFRHQKPSVFVRALTETQPSRPESGDASGPRSGAGTVTPILQRPVTFLSQISLMVPDDIERDLTLSGTREAITKVKALVSLFDVPENPILLRLRLRKSTGDARNSSVLIASATMETRNDQTSQMTLLVEGHPFHFGIGPHQNGNGSLTVKVEMTFEEQPKIKSESGGGLTVRQTRCVSTVLLPPGRTVPANETLGKQVSLRSTVAIDRYILEIIPLREEALTGSKIAAVEGKHQVSVGIHHPVDR